MTFRLSGKRVPLQFHDPTVVLINMNLDFVGARSVVALCALSPPSSRRDVEEPRRRVLKIDVEVVGC